MNGVLPERVTVTQAGPAAAYSPYSVTVGKLAIRHCLTEQTERLSATLCMEWWMSVREHAGLPQVSKQLALTEHYSAHVWRPVQRVEAGGKPPALSCTAPFLRLCHSAIPALTEHIANPKYYLANKP